MNKIEEKVFNNSLKTCVYVEGYENINSTITVRCLIHNHVFQTKYENVKRDNRSHHICPICQQEDRNSTKIKCKCAYCQKEFLRAASKIEKSKSGLSFCSRECKDLAQRINSGEEFIKIRPDHYNKIQGKNYREKAFRVYEHKCFICGWDEDEYILEVHHIDENRDNNELNNLMILCPICHRKISSHRYNIVNNKLVGAINQDQ